MGITCNRKIFGDVWSRFRTGDSRGLFIIGPQLPVLHSFSEYVLLEPLESSCDGLERVRVLAFVFVHGTPSSPLFCTRWSAIYEKTRCDCGMQKNTQAEECVHHRELEATEYLMAGVMT